MLLRVSCSGVPLDSSFTLLCFSSQSEKHQPALLNLICSELGVEVDSILDFELCLVDTQPAVSALSSGKGWNIDS